MKNQNHWIRYLIYTFILTWGLGIIMIIPLKLLEGALSLQDDSISNLFLKYGASIGGLFTAYVVYGFDGFKRLLKRGLKWKVNIWYYVFAFLIPFLAKIHVFWTVEYAISFDLSNANLLQSIVLIFLTHLFLGGGFGEEFGWRGFMLPELNNKFNLLISSLIIGGFWVLWHVPAFLLGDKGEEEPFLAFVMVVFALSIIMSWLYAKTRGSVLIVAIFHAMINASYKITSLITTIEYSDIESNSFFWWDTIVFTAIAIILVLGYKRNFNSKHVTPTLIDNKITIKKV